MSREYIDLSDVRIIQGLFHFGDVVIPWTNKMYYDTMLNCLSLIKRTNIVMPKSTSDSDDKLNFRKLIHFMKNTLIDIQTKMINVVEEVINNNIRDISVSTAMKLNKQNSVNKYSI